MRAFISVVAIIFGTTVSSSLASESLLIMPEELVDYAKKNGCDQVSDFFNRPGIVNPPYVYDSPSDPVNYGAALWCQSGAGNDKKYFLLISIKKDHKWAKCPIKIEWQRYPGGLSIYKQHIALKDFVYLNNPSKRGPQNVELNESGILSEYDGVEELLYCYKGEWLVRKRH